MRAPAWVAASVKKLEFQGSIAVNPIRTTRQLSLFCSIALLAACANGGLQSYELSGGAKSRLGSLDRTQALDIVRRNIATTDDHGGFCYHFYNDGVMNSGMSIPSQISMSGTVIAYSADSNAASSTNYAPGVGTASVHVGSVSHHFEADLTKLQAVNIGLMGTTCLYKNWPGPMITLVAKHDGLFHNQQLGINVAPNQVDEFIAALKLVAPQATFKVVAKN